MVLNWLKSKVNPIAVDIGTDSIKLLQVEPHADQAYLVAAAGAEIPPDLRDKPRERDEFVTDSLKKLLHNGGFKGTKIVTCLPAGQMAVQHLRMGRMSDEEIKKALPFEVAGKLPFDASRAVLRHVIAGEVYQEQEAKTEVILMATSRESVERHLGILNKTKLEVAGIHVEPTALIECFGHLFRRKGDENLSTMFVDIGAGSTHVVIAHGKHMVFAKHVQIGGNAFTKAVMDVLKGSFTMAREVRITLSHQSGPSRLPAGVVAISTGANGSALGLHNSNGHPLPDSETIDKAVAALDEPINHLVTELELCVRYYESIFPGKQIDRVIFIGGESRHVSICQKIAQGLGLPATLGDPLARLVKDEKTVCNLDLRQPQPGWAIAVGLAIGITGEDAKKDD